jgi:hypothetical protein
MTQSNDDEVKTTRTMQRRLFAAPDFDTFVKDNGPLEEPPQLSRYLTDLCLKCRLTVSESIKCSGIDRTYGYQLFNGTRQPSRDKLLQLAFGMGLTVEDTQQMLKIARKPQLYPLILRDAAILRCLNDRQTLMETQELLNRLGLTLLGGEDAHE